MALLMIAGYCDLLPITIVSWDVMPAGATEASIDMPRLALRAPEQICRRAEKHNADTNRGPNWLRHNRVYD